MPPIIRIENLSKSYRIVHGQPRAGYRTFREALTDLALAPLRRLRNGRRSGQLEEFWALKDVSLEVQQGEVLGIIGRNGAGKSTLLKILSRITPPTSGRAEIRGRVGSLLEVGTGFHPELSGRENIYLNGAILGMRRREIQRKFDEIVDFSGVEKFLDTPVKRYSSGMYVRLAFAVAAHLETEVLFVDEVLAVGDAEFQKKCLGKMGEVARCGRTILFVSHNMAAIQSICQTAVLLRHGTIQSQGHIGTVVREYLLQNTPQRDSDSASVLARSPSGKLALVDAILRDEKGETVSAVQLGRSCHLDLLVKTACPITNAECSIGINTYLDQRVVVLHSKFSGTKLSVPVGDHAIRVSIPFLNLLPDTYYLDIKMVSDGEVLLWAPRIAQMVVEATDFLGHGVLPTRDWGGVCVLWQSWHVEPLYEGPICDTPDDAQRSKAIAEVHMENQT